MSWSLREIQQLCKITRGASPRPIQNWMTEREDGIPWIKISDATSSGGRTIERTAGRILREGEEKSVSVYEGDLILSNSATPGIPKFVGIHACIHDGWLLLREFKDTVPEFLFYLLKHERRNLVAQGNGSVFTNLKTDILKNHQVSVPPLTEQKAIAHILGTLDDKIELNQKMNQTLEDIAKAIFKSWFVDFDPVRAKAEGRPTGLPPEISDLFPDELVDSEIGEIPKGWEVVIVGDFGKVVCGKTPSTKDPENFDGQFPFITIPDMREGLLSISTDRSVSEKGATTLKGKMLPPGSICVSCIATPGIVSMTISDSFTNQQINSIVPKNETDREYLLFSMKTLGDLISSAGSGGSVFANLSTGRFKELPVLEASQKLRDAYSLIIRPILQRIESSEKEIEVLTDLRDTLLPKLISGELRIPDAEKFLAEAGV